MRNMMGIIGNFKKGSATTIAHTLIDAGFNVTHVDVGHWMCGNRKIPEDISCWLKSNDYLA